MSSRIHLVTRIIIWFIAYTSDVSSLTDTTEFGDDNCDITQHLISFGSQVPGIGVYAGKNFTFDERYEHSNFLLARGSGLRFTGLNDFLEGVNDTHSAVALGYSAMFNHISKQIDKMVHKYASGLPLYEQVGYAKVTCSANRSVTIGEQIFADYGSEWFEYRDGIPEISPYEVGGDYVRLEDPIHAPSRVPVCPTMTTKVSSLTK